MRQVERYVFLHLLWPTVLVTAGLTSIIWLTQVLRFIDFMLNRGLSIGDFMFLTGLMLPSLLLVLIPIGLAIAVLYTYNRLTADSELIVMNAVGLSRLQLAQPAMVMGAICAVICYALSLYLMPVANAKFSDIRTFFRDKYASVLLEEDVFNNPINGITVFVRERDTDNNLSGILLHDNRDLSAPMTMMAERGRLEQTPTGPRFYLEHGVRQQMQAGRVSWLRFDNYALDIAFYATDIVRKRDPDERTIGELLTVEAATPEEATALRAEAHQRLIWPLFAIALPLIGLAMLSTGEFNRRGQWKRLVRAAAVIVALVMLYFALRNVAMNHGWMTPLLYLLVLGSIGASVYMLATGRSLRIPRALPATLAEG